VHYEAGLRELVGFRKVHPYLRGRSRRGRERSIVGGRGDDEVKVILKGVSGSNLKQLQRVRSLVVDKRKHFAMNAALVNTLGL
jgi:hypothetical protein